MCGNIDHESARFRQVKLDRLQKPVLILDMLKNVEQQQKIEVSTELLVALMDVVEVERAHAAHVLLQGHLVEFESSDRYSVVILYVPLQQTMAAADLGGALGI